MKKIKILSSILAVSMILGTAYSENLSVVNDATVVVSAAKISENGLKYCTYPSMVIIVGVEDETIESIEIPEKIENKLVKRIEDGAFSNCSNLKEIVFPDSLIDLSGSGLHNTPWYQNQPDGVVYAGNLVYGYKGEMPENTTVTFKEGTTKILRNAFYSQENLVGVEFPDSITYIGESTFEECTGLTEITIPGNVETIAHQAFRHCENLTNLTLSEGIKAIQDSAFSFCYSLEKVIIPNSVDTLGWAVFSYCKNLTEAKLPDNLTFIPMGTFGECYKLANLEIPDTVTFIGQSAFLLTSVTQLIIPPSVETIEFMAFGGTYDIENDSEFVPIPGFKIYGIKGTAAEEYANKYGIEFIEWDGTPLEQLPPNTDVVFTETTPKVTTAAETTESQVTMLLPEATLKGDANCDNIIDIRDVTMICGYIVKTKNLTEQQLANADVEKNNIVDIKDLSLLKKYLIKDISSL
ncbi:MAG: leucine-rich repeat protein [Oscillospiraceae bacterium]